MQLEQVKRLERGIPRRNDEHSMEPNLELLSVYTNGVSRNKVTEEEAAHLRALKLKKSAMQKYELSKNEVRVYLFLARFGAQKAQRIAEALSVHRTEAYKILRRLEKQGLVSCVFERPMKFMSVPFEKALGNLIEERRQRIILEGDVADPANPPPGCYFNPRCSYRIDRCESEEPALREIAPDHFVSCHRAEELKFVGVLGPTEAMA